jgi:predicted transcriptional regulator
MTLAELADALHLEVITGETNLDREVTTGYASDLLSDVMANAREGGVWITLQNHQNIVAVATMKDLAGVILIGGRRPEPQAVARAREERIPILSTEMPAYTLAGRLFALGVQGT